MCTNLTGLAVASLLAFAATSSHAETFYADMTPEELATYFLFGLRNEVAFTVGDQPSQTHIRVAKTSTSPVTMEASAAINGTSFQPVITVRTQQNEPCVYTVEASGDALNLYNMTTNNPYTVKFSVDFSKLATVTLVRYPEREFGARTTLKGVNFRVDCIKGECASGATWSPLVSSLVDFPVGLAREADYRAQKDYMTDAISHFKRTVCPAR